MKSRSIVVPFYLGVSLSVFLFLNFIAISDCVFNNENNYSTRACWISNNYNHFGATRLVGYLSFPARPRCIQNCVYPRAFMTLRVAQFSLKIAHLSFPMGPPGPRASRSPSPIMAPDCVLCSVSKMDFYANDCSRPQLWWHNYAVKDDYRIYSQ